MNHQLTRHIKDGTTISSKSREELFSLVRSLPWRSLRVSFSGRRYYAASVTFSGPPTARRFERWAQA